MKKITYIIFYAVILYVSVSCTSINVAKKVKADKKTGKVPEVGNESVVTVPIEAPPVVIEQPIWMPNGTAPQQNTKPQGLDAVQQAARRGILKPQDYSKAAIVYDFNADWVYEVYCQPLRAV
ncbi:MAG: hypothetical protein LBD20_07580, partial [Spirochaetaceae bacterium]|nr:hypothetical protein [Spirochaetaceae bacterium]